VQIVREGGQLETLKTIVVGKDDLNGYITRMHLENLRQQRLLWKPHSPTSLTWAFLKVNNNQLVDLDHNQIMGCIFCHVDFVDLEILAMHTRCRKGFITYHKTNGITTMKKHVDADHFALMRKLAKDLTIVLTKVPLDQKANKKKAHAFPSTISTQVGFQEDLMFFVVKEPLI
jgi:hypothetical protein